jgi:hypothetical protein
MTDIICNFFHKTIVLIKDVTAQELELSIEKGLLIDSPPTHSELTNFTLESQVMRNQLDNIILPLTDDVKCLKKEFNSSDTLNNSTNLSLNNKSDDELKFLLTESVDSNFTLNYEESDKIGFTHNEKENLKNLQSENVITAIMALIKDLNLDGLNMVIKECEYRRTLFYNHNQI